MLKDYLLPIIVASIAGFGGYLAARMSHSGRIETSEAKDLWAESQQMRRELRDEVKALREQLAEAHAEADRLRDRVIELEGIADNLSGRINPQ